MLLIKRSQTLHVTFRLGGLGLTLFQACFCLFDTCFILGGVDDKQGLVLLDLFSLLEQHLFQESLYTGVDLDKTGGADTSDILAKDFDILL